MTPYEAYQIKLQCLQLLLTFLGVILIPLFIFIAGQIISKNLKDREINTKYIEFAISLLKDPYVENKPELKDWALRIINRYSDEKLPPNIDKVPFFGPHLGVMILVKDESGKPIVGAEVYVNNVVNNTRTCIARNLTNAGGIADFGYMTHGAIGVIEIDVLHENYEDFTLIINPRLIDREIILKQKVNS